MTLKTRSKMFPVRYKVKTEPLKNESQHKMISIQMAMNGMVLHSLYEICPQNKTEQKTLSATILVHGFTVLQTSLGQSSQGLTQ